MNSTRPARRGRTVLALTTVAVTVLALVAVVTWLVPGQRDETGQAAGLSPAAGLPTATGPPTAASQVGEPGPVIPGLSTADRQAVEHGCGTSGVGSGRTPPTPGVTDTANSFRLYNLLDDQAGRVGLLYGEHAVLNCVIGGPAMPYNAGFRNFAGALPAAKPIAVDVTGAEAGGDGPGSKPTYRGQLGTEVVGGRVSDQVTKVTVTQGEQTVTAVLANGTFIARILHPSTWRIPDNYSPGVVRAYDSDGTLLATIDQPRTR
jgi:hypothetical protein